MRYLSVCSGIEAATSAWHELGWKPVAFSEIEPFPSAVLKHHYPDVPNLGDMTKYKEWDIGTIDILVGGTPCQSFSVAGLRKGLEDPRGNLALVYCGILDKFRPKWFVWENVPGVLSSNGGRDFGSFLGAVAQLGYGFSYRVLDAQYFGVPQRRRRVFVVGCLGGWEHSAEVLFESSCLLRNPPPSREKRQGFTASPLGSIEVSGPLQARDYKDSGTDGFNTTSSKLIPTVVKNHPNETVGALCADTHPGAYSGQDAYTGRLIPVSIVYENHPNDSRVKEMGDVCTTVTSRWGTGGGNVPFVATGNKDATDLVAYSIREDAKANTFSATEIEVSNAIQALVPSVQSHHAQTFITESTVVHGTQDPCVSDIAFAQGRNNGGENVLFQHPSSAVRRLTPIECERLQGFKDGHTNIPWRGKPESPDGLRYKALGNSMAVPCMNWIGKRISLSQQA